MSRWHKIPRKMKTQESHGRSCGHRYEDVSENDLSVNYGVQCCKMKNASRPTLWYAELEHIHQSMQKAGAQAKLDLEMIAQIIYSCGQPNVEDHAASVCQFVECQA